MEAGIIGFCGPLPILALFLFLFRNRLRGWQRVGFAVIVYIISFATGVFLAEIGAVSNDESAIIAGIVAPLAYGIIFSVIVAVQKPKVSAAAPTAEAASSSPTPAPTNQWNPIIVAALIQAAASIIIALINMLGK